MNTTAAIAERVLDAAGSVNDGFCEDGGWKKVTVSELKVVRLVADGLTNKAIAEALHLSRFTVETHLKHVFAKVGVSTRAALAAQAVRFGVRRAQDT